MTNDDDMRDLGAANDLTNGRVHPTRTVIASADVRRDIGSLTPTDHENLQAIWAAAESSDEFTIQWVEHRTVTASCVTIADVLPAPATGLPEAVITLRTTDGDEIHVSGSQITAVKRHLPPLEG